MQAERHSKRLMSPHIRAARLSSLLLWAIAAASFAPNPSCALDLPIRINVGGPAYVDTVGMQWQADSGYNTGNAGSTGSSIAGTSDPALFQSLRWDDASVPELQYAFSVPNGSYEVRLYFAETHAPAFAVGRRVFSVDMEGARVLSDIDVYAEAGAGTALIKSSTVEAGDGQLNIAFIHGVIENPFVNAIEILSAAAPGLPSPPANLSATAFSSSQITLSWNAAPSTAGVTGYQVERCQGSTCSNFAPIADSLIATYADGGLAASTTYRYRVRARDGSGNVGGYSEVAASTWSTSPVSPIRVNAGGGAYTDSTDRVWSADSGFNTGYLAGTGASITGTSDPALYQTQRWDQGSPPELQYGFAVPNGVYQVNLHFAESWSGAFFVGGRVFSVQLEGLTVLQNLDVYAEVGANAALIKSASASVTNGQLDIGFVHGPADNPIINAIEIISTPTADPQAPTVPAALLATPVASTQVNLSWSGSSDNVGVTGYRLERCLGPSCANFAEIGSPVSVSFSDTTPAASKTYRYRVRAADAAGNLSGYSTPVRVTMPAQEDTQAPSTPAGLVATVVSTMQVQLNWTGSSDNVRVASYSIERCAGTGCSSFVQIATTLAATFVDNSVNGSTLYNYRVRAADSALNVSAYSNIASVTTGSASDIQPPTVPTGLNASTVSGREVALTWLAATDDVGVARYLIERCLGAACTNFSQVGTASSPAYGDVGLSAATNYRYRVRAVDAANNVSAYSSIAAAQTAAMNGKAGGVVYEYDSFGRLKRVTVTPQ